MNEQATDTMDWLATLPAEKAVKVLVDSGRVSWKEEDREYLAQLIERIRLHASRAYVQRPRMLDEREVREVAKKTGLPRYMWDTDEVRMDLARFAHEASRLQLNAPTKDD